jgi:hypothetical protein
MEMISKHDRNSSEFFEKRAREIESSIDPAKAQELRDAYDSRGRIHYRMSYLPTCGIPCEVHEVSGPKDGCPQCQFYQPEIFNQFLRCEKYEPAPQSQPGRSGGSGQKIRIERRETEIDRMGFEQPRTSRAREQAEQLAQEMMTAAAQKVSGPVGQAEQMADQFVTSLFQKIRGVISGAGDRNRLNKICPNGHVNSADRRRCETCGQPL